MTVSSAQLTPGVAWPRRPGVEQWFFYGWGDRGSGGNGDSGSGGGGGGGSAGTYADVTVTGSLDDYYYPDQSGASYVSTGNFIFSGTIILQAPAGNVGGDGSGGAGGAGGGGDSLGIGDSVVAVDGSPGDDPPGSNGGAGGVAHVGTGVNAATAAPDANGGKGGDNNGGTGVSGGGGGSVWVDWPDPTLAVTDQPADADSGASITDVECQIRFPSTSPDTNASTAPAGNTVTIDWVWDTGGGSGIGGTTSVSYGSGADGSKAKSTDLTITGSGTGHLVFTDDVSGVSVNSSTITITATTAYTFTGPSSGTVNVASTDFTLTPSGSPAATETITPHTTGAGSFTPSTVTFDGTNSAMTFTYTPTSTSGSPHTLTVTNSGSLSNPSSIAYTVNAGASGGPFPFYMDDLAGGMHTQGMGL